MCAYICVKAIVNGLIPGLRLFSHALERSSVLSFTLDGYSIEKIGMALNQLGIAVQTGRHRAQPVLRSLGVEGTVRPVLVFYNTPGEVDSLVKAVRNLR